MLRILVAVTFHIDTLRLKDPAPFWPLSAVEKLETGTKISSGSRIVEFNGSRQLTKPASECLATDEQAYRIRA